MDTSNWAVSVPPGYRVGRWQVTTPIGGGGWAGVYAARSADDKLPDDVAIKFLPTQTVTARRLRQLTDMATREASAGERLRHPRLVRRYETIVLADRDRPDLDGSVAVVMERGKCSFADLLYAGGVDLPSAGKMIAQVCEGLAYMHHEGWVHGDLKPSNILVMPDGSLCLADFGLATELEGTHGYLLPIGSPDYVSPERSTDRPSERGVAIRPSADVWALGVIAHQVVKGSYPFPGSSSRARSDAAAAYVDGRAELVLSRGRSRRLAFLRR